MLIRYGYELTLNCQQPTFMLCMLDAHRERAHHIRYETPVITTPQIDSSTYIDLYGNHVRRLIAPAGDLAICCDAVIDDSGLPDPVVLDAQEVVMEQIPSNYLVYLLGSRYCETDKLGDIAWQLFGSTPRGWHRVQAICDFVCDHLTFGYEYARATRTAYEAFEERKGVCRDFAHLAVTFCRCMNIPARYTNGFLGDIGVPSNPTPMDYNAWFEVYLDGGWFTFDARHNTPRIGRIPVARGRDAIDVAMVTSFGPHSLTRFRVWTEEINEGVLQDLIAASLESEALAFHRN
ncbi:transglutaminase-like domain-containing protein [Beijerinckia indica]|uniref:Transglutaminase domain protein n=1 Tax=Beijerinckia indica subsp. indica (strain ATCC 9039 / DSM 1715 / NCIMB 8712) TaxID=395963 RepID=B2ILF9_BEII9|nr:transglutaminase family protein [Beijerinckia indica]ACB97359.1 transglutaminase domain protein [Beijerinckia indica subsp. indica ATCC 9039]